MLLRRHFSVTRIITCFHLYGVWLQRVPVCRVLQFLLVLSTFPLLWLKREQEVDKDVLSLPFPFFLEIIQVTWKPAPCLQALLMHTRPFSGMPRTFPLPSTDLHELLPPLKTSPLQQNTIWHIQHTAPAALRLSAQLSCTPPSHTPPLTHKVPQEAPEADVTSLAGQVPAALCCQRWLARSSTPAASKPTHPTRARCFGRLEEPAARKQAFFRTIKSLPRTQALHSQGKVVWTLPWAVPQPLPAMRMVLLAQSSSRPHRGNIHGLSLQESHINPYSKTSALVLQICSWLVAFWNLSSEGL